MMRCERCGSPPGIRAATAVVAIAAVVALAGQREVGRRAIHDAREATRHEARAREDALRTATEERTRIARELHDVLGHSLGVIVVQAGAAAQVVDDDPVAVRLALESIRQTGSRSLDEMREVLAFLRGGGTASARLGLDELPLLVERSRSDELAIEFDERGRRPPLSPGAHLALYRIAQEALTNVRRHAAARTARVVVTHTTEAVRLSVVDDGCGRSPGAVGSGIVGMRERAALHGGTVEAGPSADGIGWRIEARLPVGGFR